MKKESITEEKSVYRVVRDELGYSRDYASELLEFIPSERLGRIENGVFTPKPDEVKRLAEVYNRPDLCNYYCAHQCEIGKEYVPEVKISNLAQIVLGMMASLNAMDEKKEKLIEIAADGEITNDEIEDFNMIQEKLEEVSLAVEALQLWTKKMKAEGFNSIEL